MRSGLSIAPEAFVSEMLRQGTPRVWLAPGRGSALRASHSWLGPLAEALGREPDLDGHEAIFLAADPRSGALFGAFLHRLTRGQAQGGLRHWRYESLAEVLRDGLRLSRGMGRKIALAGLWWGGGKGLIARPPGAPAAGEARRALFRAYGEFVSSLRGCYVTAEDAGTEPDDVAAVFERTRFVTCVPPAFGGSGNPSEATAEGVVCGMEAALAALERGGLAGKCVALQGLGQVGAAMVERLLARGVARLVASDVSPERARAVAARHPGGRLQVRVLEAGDTSLLAEACDVLAPSAMGGVLGPETIPLLRAAVVCGAANNPLLDEHRDAETLRRRGIAYVPDYVVNRMGIVRCADEQSGTLPDDPAVQRHLDPAYDHGIPAVVRRVLALSRERGIPTTEAAEALADRLAAEPHPIFGERARALVRALLASDWHAVRTQGGAAEETPGRAEPRTRRARARG